MNNVGMPAAMLLDLWCQRWFPDVLPASAQLDTAWVVLCTALSQSAMLATGLPVDFQIQQMTYANEKYAKSRSPLGLVRMRR